MNECILNIFNFFCFSTRYFCQSSPPTPPLRLAARTPWRPTLTFTASQNLCLVLSQGGTVDILLCGGNILTFQLGSHNASLD